MAYEAGGSALLISQLRQMRNGTWDSKVLRRSRLCLLDSLSCYCAGRTLPHSVPSTQVARNLFGAASPFATAYLYGQAANALDYDDTLLGHPGAPIVAAVLAVAARDRLSSDRVLRGIAAGYEAHAILCAAAAPSPGHAALVRSVGNWDTAAAAIGASVALDLESTSLERVIGVALTHSILPYTAKWYERPVPAIKNNMGWIAAGAVLSVDLVAAGMSGITAPLDGDTGMWRMAGSDRWSLETHPGAKPAVLRTGFKHYPACWHLQEHLKAFSRLLASIGPDDPVLQVTVASPPDMEKFFPATLTGTADVAFSLPATFSLLIAGVEPGPLWDFFDDSCVRQAFNFERSDHRMIRVRTRGGAEHTVDVGFSDGADLAAAGLDEAGVLAKFERLTDLPLRRAALAAFALDLPSNGCGGEEAFYVALRQVSDIE